MGMARVNVWVSEMDDPCGVSQRTWYVTFYDCHGRVLQHCGTRYLLMPAPCGHLDVEVPPGCYLVKAVWGYSVVVPGQVYRVNHFTDAGIVEACCDEHTCIKLFNPSVHRCGTIYALAVNDLVRHGLVPTAQGQELGDRINAVNALVQGEPKFELGHLPEIDAFINALALAPTGAQQP